MSPLDPKAPVRAAGHVTIDAPAPDVWAVLIDAAAWPSWYPDIRQVDLSGPLGLGTTFSFKTGPVSIAATVATFEEHRTLHFTGESRGSHAAYVFELETTGAATTVRAEQTMSGLAVKTMKPMLQKIADTSLPGWLAALKARTESAS